MLPLAHKNEIIQLSIKMLVLGEEEKKRRLARLILLCLIPCFIMLAIYLSIKIALQPFFLAPIFIVSISASWVPNKEVKAYREELKALQNKLGIELIYVTRFKIYAKLLLEQRVHDPFNDSSYR